MHSSVILRAPKLWTSVVVKYPRRDLTILTCILLVFLCISGRHLHQVEHWTDKLRETWHDRLQLRERIKHHKTWPAVWFIRDTMSVELEHDTKKGGRSCPNMSYLGGFCCVDVLSDSLSMPGMWKKYEHLAPSALPSRSVLEFSRNSTPKPRHVRPAKVADQTIGNLRCPKTAHLKQLHNSAEFGTNDEGYVSSGASLSKHTICYNYIIYLSTIQRYTEIYRVYLVYHLPDLSVYFMVKKWLGRFP